MGDLSEVRLSNLNMTHTQVFRAAQSVTTGEAFKKLIANRLHRQIWHYTKFHPIGAYTI